MRLCRPSFEILKQEAGLEGIYKQIELAGRVCYKSEDKITEDSCKDFIEMLKNKQHLSALEHGAVYLKIPIDWENYDEDSGYKSHVDGILYNKYSKCNCYDDYLYLSTNYRVIIENDWGDYLKYLCEPTKHHQKRITVKFICDIGVSREYNRHRANSMAEQSTRYCDYSLEKHGRGLNIMQLPWVKESIENNYLWNCYLLEPKATQHDFVMDREGNRGGYSQVLYELDTYHWTDIDWWIWSNRCSELAYMKLREKGWTPQQARTVLPLDTKSELIHTAFISDWEHFFSLRCAPSAHPQARELAGPLMDKFAELGYISHK